MTLINFAYYFFTLNMRKGIHKFNENIKYYFKYCNKLFIKYIASLYDSSYTYELNKKTYSNFFCF